MNRIFFFFFNQFLSRHPRHQFSASPIYTVTFLDTTETLVTSSAGCTWIKCFFHVRTSNNSKFLYRRKMLYICKCNRAYKPSCKVEQCPTMQGHLKRGCCIHLCKISHPGSNRVLHFSVNIVDTLTHISLASYFWDIGKQYSPKTQRLIWGYSVCLQEFH